MPNATAVVSTLGILLESDYKPGGLVSPLGVLRGVLDHAFGAKGNPLDPKRKTYDKFNRDAGESLTAHCPLSTLLPSHAEPSPAPTRGNATTTTPLLLSPGRVPRVCGVALAARGRRELAVRIPLGGGRVPALRAGAVHRDQAGGGAGYLERGGREPGGGDSRGGGRRAHAGDQAPLR